MNISKLIKADILEIIFHLNDEKTLRNIYQHLKKIIPIPPEKKQPHFMDAVTTIRRDISFEQIIQEQNYTPITYDTFRDTADTIEWNETLKELLEAIDN